MLSNWKVNMNSNTDFSQLNWNIQVVLYSIHVGALSIKYSHCCSDNIHLLQILCSSCFIMWYSAVMTYDRCYTTVVDFKWGLYRSHGDKEGRDQDNYITYRWVLHIDTTLTRLCSAMRLDSDMSWNWDECRNGFRFYLSQHHS